MQVHALVSLSAARASLVIDHKSLAAARRAVPAARVGAGRHRSHGVIDRGRIRSALVDAPIQFTGARQQYQMSLIPSHCSQICAVADAWRGAPVRLTIVKPSLTSLVRVLPPARLKGVKPRRRCGGSHFANHEVSTPSRRGQHCGSRPRWCRGTSRRCRVIGKVARITSSGGTTHAASAVVGGLARRCTCLVVTGARHQ